MDKRKNNGGARKGAGRKPKATELEFLERLDNVIDSETALHKLKSLILEENFNAIKLYLEYRFGKPKDKKEVDITTKGESLNYTEEERLQRIKELSELI